MSDIADRMNVSLEERKRAALEPEKREIETLLAELIASTIRPTNRQKFFLREALDNARRGLFQLARQDIEDFHRPESEWSPRAVISDARVEGVNREILQRRLDELRALPPQWPPMFTDFAAWSAEQGALLRRVADGEPINEEVDWGNVIEEIESLGRAQKNELANRIRTVLEHLLRLTASPANDPKPGWRTTIARSRAEIEALLEDSPSLRPLLDEIIAAELPRARKIAAAALAEYGEQPTVPLDQLSFTNDQVLDAWLPEDSSTRGPVRS